MLEFSRHSANTLKKKKKRSYTMKRQNLFGSDAMAPHFVDLLWALAPLAGGESRITSIWEMYIRNELINPDGSMWGDKNPDGSSKGPIPHSIVVASVLAVTAKRLGLTAADIETITVAGLVHDAFKRQEIESGDP